MRIRSIAAGVLVTLASCDCDSAKLFHRDPRCGEACYGGEQRFAGVGTCRRGTWECSPTGGIECVGWVPPGNPECNALDNDCDGSAPDLVYQDCSNSCGAGARVCVGSTFGPCSLAEPIPEVCNGIDDDCNGIVDDVDPNNVRFCYDGPPGTAQFGDCHPGVIKCITGKDICSNEKTPVKEICDGIDNDCNGLIDDGLGRQQDVVFAIDYSGSMGDKIANVQGAVAGWSIGYNNPDYRFALIATPSGNSAYNGDVLLIQDFTDAPTFVSMIAAPMYDLGTGMEPTLDAIHDVVDPTNPLRLSWRSGPVRTMILFSDEEPQTYDPSVIGRTIATVADEVAVGDVEVDVFTVGYFFPLYQPIIAAHNGGVYDIIEPSSGIQSDLGKILSGQSCR